MIYLICWKIKEELKMLTLISAFMLMAYLY